MYERYRVKATAVPVIIVHRRKGREKIRSAWDKKYNGSGKWGTVCNVWTNGAINITTDWSKVTCMHCLKKRSI